MITSIYIFLFLYSIVNNISSTRLTGKPLLDICQAASCIILAIAWPAILLANTVLVLPKLYESFAYHYIPEPLTEEELAQQSTVSQLNDLLQKDEDYSNGFD